MTIWPIQMTTRPIQTTDSIRNMCLNHLHPYQPLDPRYMHPYVYTTKHTNGMENTDMDQDGGPVGWTRWSGCTSIQSSTHDLYVPSEQHPYDYLENIPTTHIQQQHDPWYAYERPDPNLIYPVCRPVNTPRRSKSNTPQFQVTHKFYSLQHRGSSL